MPGPRSQLAQSAAGHADRLRRSIDRLDRELSAIRPDLGKPAGDELDSASVNGDLFWSSRDIIRNLDVLAVGP